MHDIKLYRFFFIFTTLVIFFFTANESLSSLSDLAMGINKDIDREDLIRLKEGEGKVSSQILNTVNKIQSQGITRDKLSELRTEEFSSALVKVNKSGAIQVYIYVDEVTDENIKSLSDLDVSIEIANKKLAIIQGWIHFYRMDEVSSLDFVIKITPPSYGTPRAGSVNTEGDEVMRSDEVRNNLGIDGSGVIVGAISDGVQNIASSQATGDLPGDICIVDPGSDDEGTALLEIIYDIAPGASLAFAGSESTLEFIQSIDNLINICNVDVIVDDLGFFGQPFFEDGSVADAVSDAINQGIVFVSAAGNDADGQHYQALYEDTNPVLDANMGNPLADFHDFGIAAGDVTDIGMPLLIGPGEVVTVFLQWNDPALGDTQDNVGLSSNDYDLFLIPFTANFLCVIGEDIIIGCRSFSLQDGSQDPFEVVTILNTSIIDLLLIDVGINRFSGEPRTLEMFINGPGIFTDYPTSSDSIFGHPAVPEVITVGAVPWDDPLTVEPFSSQGPSTIFFPNFVERPKPDIVAPNRVSITGAGGFPSGSPGIFPGTSASAPHVAGVAALILEADPSLTPADVKNAMTSTAIDIIPNLLASVSSLDVNSVTRAFNNTAGFGLVDALAAVQSVLPEPPPDIENICNDQIDNDNDNKIDCADEDCDGVEVDNGVCESPIELSCNDGFDNDGDGLADCDDPACEFAPNCAAEPPADGGGGGGGCSLSQSTSLNISNPLLNLLVIFIPVAVIIINRFNRKKASINR